MFDLGYVEGEYDVGNVITRSMNRGRAERVTLGYSYLRRIQKVKCKRLNFDLTRSALEAIAFWSPRSEFYTSNL